MSKRIQLVTEPIVPMGAFTKFSIIGDPGCEGLGTVTMQTYASALEKAAKDELILIVGDMVPEGSHAHYQFFMDLTETIEGPPVYVLRGNHDIDGYEDVFGLPNYALLGEKLTIVALDNAQRAFSQESLDFLGQVLSRQDVQNVVLAFHIPLPNRFTGNTVSQAEMERLREVYAPWKQKLRYFLCGHVHAGFADIVDGVPMVCTGGGGAQIEDVSPEITASDVNHHIVRFHLEDDHLIHEVEELRMLSYRTEIQDPIISEQLSQAVAGELYAHLHYLTYAERAERRGYPAVADLFRALAESEYRHARSFFALLNPKEPFDETIRNFLPREIFEHERLYPMMAVYAADHGAILTQHAYRSAARAEKHHAYLLSQVELDASTPRKTWAVCSICGFITGGESEVTRCPVCGSGPQMWHTFGPKEK